MPPNRPLFSTRRLNRPQAQKQLNPSARPADVAIRGPSPPSATNPAGQTNRPIAVPMDLASAPQPFLDPEVWLRMKSVAAGRA
ncbi:hypothetical protein PHISP_07686 [Aspergillus sp. HF37]|nr:hypothetical protein PHISP_07686 [Aspergillus sp. HF37]